MPACLNAICGARSEHVLCAATKIILNILQSTWIYVILLVAMAPSVVSCAVQLDLYHLRCRCHAQQNPTYRQATPYASFADNNSMIDLCFGQQSDATVSPQSTFVTPTTAMVLNSSSSALASKPFRYISLQDVPLLTKSQRAKPSHTNF